MTCSGCVGAVNRVLSKEPKVGQVDISLENQTVKVSSDTLSQDDILAIIKKSGKETSVV